MADLQALFHDDQPPVTDEALTLLAAEIDDPSRYVFEPGGWPSVYGASRQLLALDEALRLALTEATGVRDFLQADAGQIMTLLADPLAAPDVLSRLARIPPDAMGVVTLSGAAQRLTVRQLLGGLYRAPDSVIGIPGVNSYQGRINRYYGLASPSTIPTPDAIHARRHFGEVTALARQLIAQARESRSVFPFYETLPFAETCGLCRMRPAARLGTDGAALIPICDVCQRKRQTGAAALHGSALPPSLAAIVCLRVPGLESLLMAQPTPAAYRRTVATLAGALRRAATGSGALLLWQSGGEAILAASAEGVLDALVRAYVTYTALTRGAIHRPLPLYIGAAVGRGAPETLHTAAQTALIDALHTPGGIGLRVAGAPSADTAFYAPDDLERLQHDLAAFTTDRFPVERLADLPDQIGRGSVALYYAYARTGLDDRARRRLDALENGWGKDTARFYRALSDLIGLQTLIG